MAETSSEQPSRKEDSRDDGRSMCETVFTYHEQTKHHFHRYARSLGYMDWATQPHPFRHYVTVHGQREGDRHIFPGHTFGNHPTGRHTSLEFAGKMSQSPARERLRNQDLMTGQLSPQLECDPKHIR